MLSQISLERWEAQRRREQREFREAQERKQKPPKSPAEIEATRTQRKAIKKQKEDEARGSLLYGTPQGELYLTGIEQRNPPRAAKSSRKFWTFRRKKKVEGRNSMMLEGIIPQVREAKWRDDFGSLQGSQDRPPDEDENQHVPF